MATSEHISNLIKAYIEHDDERFKTVVLQIAAYEAKHGHENYARELKQYTDKIGKTRNSIVHLNQQNPMLNVTVPNNRLTELIVSEDILSKITRILNEYRSRIKLHKFGLSNRRKILIEGKPGTGKTFTASVIASELGLPLYTVQMDKLITKFMGETSSKLRQIFDMVANNTGVYFFDEFDAIGADRRLDNEVGEMRRILNSFLQFIEQDASDSLIIAATNNQGMLDQALFRRFDDVLHYLMPTKNEARRLFQSKISMFDKKYIVSDSIVEKASYLSHAEIINVCNDAIKGSILGDSLITDSVLDNLINERISAYSTAEA